MSFPMILNTVFIGPVKLLIEYAFDIINKHIGYPELSEMFLGLLLYLLFLPVILWADDAWISVQKGGMGGGAFGHKIKDKGLYWMKITAPLLLRIPLFLAACQFFTEAELFYYATLGPITVMGEPDGLLALGAMSVNLLPLIAGWIDLGTKAFCLKGSSWCQKVLFYGETLFFVSVLYTAPACMAVFWLVIELLEFVRSWRIQHRVPLLLCAVVGAAVIVLGPVFYKTNIEENTIMLTGIGIFIAMIPLLHIRTWFPKKKKEEKAVLATDGKQFLLSAVFLAVLTGLMIPLLYLAASPQEYVDVYYFYHPMWYAVSSFGLATGTFVVWLGLIYWLADPKGKAVIETVTWILCGVMFVNCMFFGTKLGILSSNLKYVNEMTFSGGEKLFNLLTVVLLTACLYGLKRKWRFLVSPILAVFILVLCGMTALNTVTVVRSVDKIATRGVGEEVQFPLSKTGKNVVVLMLDRALGEYIPYIFNEKPELQEKFSGFTYYRNTISFAGYTIFATPALFGGYEYTPVEINKRDTESLAEKHNEALKVMPVLFSENGYEVTVCDLPYANYQLIPDLSIFDEYPGIQTYQAMNLYADHFQTEDYIKNLTRNFFCFSLMKTLPLVAQPILYDRGIYHKQEQAERIIQVRTSLSTAEGTDSSSVVYYQELSKLDEMTTVTDEGTNTFLALVNDLTHEPTLLQEPGYSLSNEVDNTAYDAEHTERFTIGGRELKMEEEDQVIHYQTNVAALLLLGEWFDYLRANDVYDNTRIIVVADHGRTLWQLEDLYYPSENGELVDTESYYPLLMVKDFNSEKFTVSDEFMTNADVPVLAMEGLIDSPVNPFTGNPITNHEKFAHEQFVSQSQSFDLSYNTGNSYKASRWASVKDNIWDPANWSFYNKETVLKEHAFPAGN